MFHSFLYVYQRVNPMVNSTQVAVICCTSHDIPMKCSFWSWETSHAASESKATLSSVSMVENPKLIINPPSFIYIIHVSLMFTYITILLMFQAHISWLSLHQPSFISCVHFHRHMLIGVSTVTSISSSHQPTIVYLLNQIIPPIDGSKFKPL